MMEQIPTELLEQEKYEEYVDTMLVRNDWLQDNGKEIETELYLLTVGSYEDYRIIGIFQGVKGLNLGKIQKWFYRKHIQASGILESIQNRDELMSDMKRRSIYYQYEQYLMKEYGRIDIHNIFINYLINRFRFKEIQVEETCLSDIDSIGWTTYLELK